MSSRYLAAVGTIVGTMVGAGILALPYAISKSGFLIGLVLLVIVGVSSILITMYTGELSFRMKKIHQLPVLISRYTNKKFRAVVLAVQVLVIYGALLAYLVAMGDSLQSILGLPYVLSVLLVFGLSAPIIHRGYMWVEKAETPLSIIKIALIVAVAIIAILMIKPGNLATSNISNTLFPFGVILFALMAFTVVPEVREELNNNSRNFNKAVIIAMVLSIAVYVFFAAAFLGAFGPGVSEIATNSLGSGQFSALYYILTIFLVVTPYIAMSLVVVDAFNYDFKISRDSSFWLAMVIPLLLALSGFNFAQILSAVGGVFLPVLCLLILYAVYKERKVAGNSRTYLVRGGNVLLLFTAAVLVVGFIYTVVYVML